MFAFIGNIGPWELVFILVIALVVVGPGKLPEVAKSIGKAMNEFKKSTSGIKRDIEAAMSFEDEPPKKITVETVATEKENAQTDPTEEQKGE